MSGRDIIVIGASAGGVEALSLLVSLLPPDLNAAVFITLHVPAHSVSALPRILSRRGPLPALHPRNGEVITPGRIYVAPPDYHLLIRNGQIELTRGPRENGHRPAIDPMFRSAALAYGPRVAGVILSGALSDGAAGMEAVKMRGGIAIVQDPDEALYAGMPRSALEQVAVDYTLPLQEIAALLTRLTQEPAPHAAQARDETENDMEQELASMPASALPEDRHPGHPSMYGCPDCGGVLWEMPGGDVLRFRCRVGHAWAAEGLLSEQVESMEAALWTALRALEESASFCQRLEARSTERGRERSAAQFAAQSQDALQHATALRNILQKGYQVGEAAAEPPARTEEQILIKSV